MVGEDGQALSRFKYTITNKSEFPIQNIQWMSVYVHNRQVVHSQDMQIELENTLLPGKTLTIKFTNSICSNLMKIPVQFL